MFYQARREEKGQGLLEYSQVLVLVAVVIIAIVAIFGRNVKDSYCKIVYVVSPNADLSAVCSRPIVIPMLQDQGPDYINIEARVNDPDGNPDDPYSTIARVEFYIDDTDSSPVQVENHYRYCLGGSPGSGPEPCENYNTSGLSSGRHEVIILAYDTNGEVGRSSSSFTK